ncbi:DUF6068 family protein [Pyxidicoccus parkwayensis]|nr:DUF6068 family protein [Pyxidicoccus parkwaysis]
MRKSPAPFLSRAGLLCAALALAPGCKSVQPKPTTPTGGTPPGQDAGPSAPEAGSQTLNTATSGTPAQGTSPWQRARVGDRVTYSFSANRSPSARRSAEGGTNVPSAVAGVVTVEVLAVKAPWVWLGISFAGDGGTPLPQPRLARSLVVPVRSDSTRTLEVPREGAQTLEQPTAAGRTWEAKRYLDDKRPVDGPLENRLYAVDPGPLYLTNGLLDASTTLSGFGAAGGSQLTLMEVHQGAADATSTLPAFSLPLGPGTFYDVRMDSGGTPSVMRTCLAAERGHVLRVQSAPTEDVNAPCPDFTQAEPLPLEEAVLSLALTALGDSQWPPRPAGASLPTRSMLAFDGSKVPVLQVESSEDVGGTRGVREVTYAADPWDGTLNGLAQEARFQALSDVLYRAPQRGKREPVDGTRLVQWGTWVQGVKP